MKKYLFVLASLSIVFGAQAADEQHAPGAKAAQERAAKHSSCRKAALDQGLKDQDLKDAIAACVKPK
ncbi:MAG: hypothetical protein AB9M53_01945 [Leptothrix sp. (in: b-proteobacteria)]